MTAKSVLLSGTRKAFGAVVLAALLSTGGMVTAAAHAQMSAKHIYPTIEAAPADIKAALAEARRTHRRVLIDFGGDWCGDCQVLDIYFHQSPNADLLAKNFVKVNVNIGRIDANFDVAERFGVPLKRGVPALAVVDEQGKVLFAQTTGDFADMRHMQSSDLTAFLEKWKR
ncbi:thioredoxin family protein [Granulicella mallensis]|jgi:thioredoxin 1|uniref:Thiol:disulfide interchange protein n=1 Tax=Granulicella mallensis TaxID=940614 RepID=A0A7W7ZPN9_9BACT|nr:thioredoxin family protein [Granulicella mallensis]MBB5063773.1 thiol:disulfide interchange protein [Granulicella mallensis]